VPHPSAGGSPDRCCASPPTPLRATFPQWPPSRGNAWRTNQDIVECHQVIDMLEDEMKPTYSSWKESVLMFCTYREVLLLGERPSPGIRLPHHLTKDVGAIVDEALEPRLVV
jgi:hypothetical protein